MYGVKVIVYKRFYPTYKYFTMPKVKKKTSYKRMMAEILKPKPKDRPSKKIEQGTGGGAFEKVVKI